MILKPLLFILSTNLWGQNYDPKIAEILKEVPSLTTPNYQCSESVKIELSKSRNSSSEKNLQNCAIALCGLSQTNPSAYVTDMNFSKFVTPADKARAKKLEPAIKKIIEKSYKDRIDILKNLIKDVESKKFEQIKIPKDSGISRYDYFQKIFSQVVSLSFDPKSSIENRVRLDYNFPVWADDNFKKIAREYGEQAKYSLTNNYALILSKKIFTTEELNKIAKDRIQVAEKYIATLDDSARKDALTNFVKSAKQRRQDNLPFNKSDFDELSEIVNNASSTPHTYFDNRCLSESCEKTIKDFFAYGITTDKINAYMNDLKNNYQLTREINQCTANYIAKNSKVRNQAKAQKQFNETMKAIKKNVLPIFSAHSRALLQKSLDRIKVQTDLGNDPPYTQKEIDNEFIATANSYLNDKMTENTDNLATTFSNLMAVAEGEVIEIETPCGGSPMVTASDATDQEKTVIYVSDYACSHDMRGQQIIAHEIGHNINYLFSQLKISESSLKKFMDIRKCITSNYPTASIGTSNKEGSFPIDSEFTEEDMADFFSTLAYPQIKDNSMCGLLEPDLQKNSYKNLLLIDTGADDDHSSTLNRVIMEAIRKDQSIPISCKEEMEKNSNLLEYNKCIQ